MTQKRRKPTVGKGKRKAGSQTEKQPRKPITGRQLTNIWLALTIAGTAAWYFLIAQPNDNTITDLENGLARAEGRLRDNENRVAELNQQITDLQTQIDEHDRALEATEYYTIPYATAPNTHLQSIIARTTELGLTTTNGIAPETWASAAPQFHTAPITLDATGTFTQIDAAIQLLEFGRVGTNINTLTIAKLGGDPNDPTLQMQTTLTAHARQRPEGARP